MYTAIPEPWSVNVELTDNPGFTIVGSLPDKKRKLREYSMSELSSKPALNIEKSPPTLLNKRRSNRTSNESSSSVKELVDEDSQTADEHSGETYKIETKRSKNDSMGRFYEEVVIQPQTTVKTSPKVRYIYLKTKGKSDAKIKKVATNTRAPRLSSTNSETRPQFVKIDEDISTYLPDDADISSTNIEEKKTESVHEPSPEPVQQTDANLPAGYKEFIFEGKMWVQMEKKVFEEELEKARSEAEHYKTLLRKLKNHLNKLDI